MDDVPESRTGRAAGPLSREASGSPASGRPLALEGLAIGRRQGITPGQWTHTGRARAHFEEPQHPIRAPGHAFIESRKSRFDLTEARPSWRAWPSSLSGVGSPPRRRPLWVCPYGSAGPAQPDALAIVECASPIRQFITNG
jgi:hypothetical protein